MFYFYDPLRIIEFVLNTYKIIIGTFVWPRHMQHQNLSKSIAIHVHRSDDNKGTQEVDMLCHFDYQ